MKFRKKRVPDKECTQALWELCDAIFDKMATREDITWFDLCKEANVSVSTFYRLMYRETKNPQFYTLFKLARCAGLSFELVSRYKQRIKKAA